jgi:DUF4097 and DUF4098 domain-containing protein YvlB
MSKVVRVAGLVGILCLIVVMTACSGLGRAEEKSTEAVDVTRPSRIFIETFNGNIEIVTGASDQVSADVTKFSDTNQRDVLQDIEFSISQDAETVTLKAQWPDDTNTSPGNTGVDLKVSIPPGSPVQAVVGNGRIDYRAALGQGNYSFSTGNGRIELHLPADAQFALDANVGNGRITSEFPLAGATEGARTVQGRVGADPQASITAVTGNGNIDVQRGD